MKFEQVAAYGPTLDKCIVEDVTELVFDFLKARGEIRNELFLMNGAPYLVNVGTGLPPHHRALAISILRTRDAGVRGQPVLERLPVNAFGTYRYVDLYLDHKLTNRNRLHRSIVECVEQAYDEFEESFKSTFKANDAELLKGLNELLNTALRRANKRGIKEKCFFSVTRIPSYSGAEPTFTFSLHAQDLAKHIQALKAQQTDFLSPYGILVSMFLHESKDDGFDAYAKGLLSDDLDLAKLKVASKEHATFLESERIVLDSSAVSFVFLDQVKNYLPALNFPASMRDDLMPVLDSCGADLNEQFKQNVRDRNALMRRLRSVMGEFEGAKGAQHADTLIVRLWGESLRILIKHFDKSQPGS